MYSCTSRTGDHANLDDGTGLDSKLVIETATLVYRTMAQNIEAGKVTQQVREQDKMRDWAEFLQPSTQLEVNWQRHKQKMQDAGFP